LSVRAHNAQGLRLAGLSETLDYKRNALFEQQTINWDGRDEARLRPYMAIDICKDVSS
jgi:hypothetical protein